LNFCKVKDCNEKAFGYYQKEGKPKEWYCAEHFKNIVTLFGCNRKIKYGKKLITIHAPLAVIK
jgi:hypothetical protein